MRNCRTINTDMSGPTLDGAQDGEVKQVLLTKTADLYLSWRANAFSPKKAVIKIDIKRENETTEDGTSCHFWVLFTDETGNPIADDLDLGEGDPSYFDEMQELINKHIHKCASAMLEDFAEFDPEEQADPWEDFHNELLQAMMAAKLLDSPSEPLARKIQALT